MVGAPRTPRSWVESRWRGALACSKRPWAQGQVRVTPDAGVSNTCPSSVHVVIQALWTTHSAGLRSARPGKHAHTACGGQRGVPAQQPMNVLLRGGGVAAARSV